MTSGARKSEPNAAQSPDWIQIEVDYRAGIKTLRQIADEQGISHGAINKRAKRDEWTRDVISRSKPVLVSEIGDEFTGPGFIYVIYFQQGIEAFYKVGMARHLDGRLKSHQCSCPFEVKVAISYFVGDMRNEEKVLHSMFECKRIRGEWFALQSQDLQEIAKRSLLV